MSELEKFAIDSEEAMIDLGKRLAATGLLTGLTIYLHGNLGAGKTTLARGILRGFSYEGGVKSPTYTLVEQYDLDAAKINHFDLYRIVSPEELFYIGIEDYKNSTNLNLVEWPEKGGDVLFPADVDVRIEYNGEGKREVMIVAKSEKGRPVLTAINST